MKRFNNWFSGIFVGMLTPFIIIWIYYQNNYSYFEMNGIMFKLFFREILIPKISLSVIINLGWFYLFLNTKREKAARGVILSTIIYAIFVFAYKIITNDMQ